MSLRLHDPEPPEEVGVKVTCIFVAVSLNVQLLPLQCPTPVPLQANVPVPGSSTLSTATFGFVIVSLQEVLPWLLPKLPFAPQDMSLPPYKRFGLLIFTETVKSLLVPPPQPKPETATQFGPLEVIPCKT